MDYLDTLNIQNSAKMMSPSSPIYICTACGRQVSYEDSYSNGFKRLTCRICVEGLAANCNLSVAEYLTKYIWK